MVRKDLAFEERLYAEYDLKRRTRIIIILSAQLPGFGCNLRC